MKLITGDQLTESQKRQVLSAYIYRWTSDNPRRLEVYRNIEHPRVPLQTDAEWLSEKAFYVTNDGRLSERHRHCVPAYIAD